MTTPKGEDEFAFWRAVKAGEYPRQAAARLGINENRAAYLCEKWADQGIYDYGVNALAGWAVPPGDVAAQRKLDLLERGPATSPATPSRETAPNGTEPQE